MLQGQALLRYCLLWLLTSAKILTRRLGGCRTTHLDAPPQGSMAPRSASSASCPCSYVCGPTATKRPHVTIIKISACFHGSLVCPWDQKLTWGLGQMMVGMIVLLPCLLLALSQVFVFSEWCGIWTTGPSQASCLFYDQQCRVDLVSRLSGVDTEGLPCARQPEYKDRESLGTLPFPRGQGNLSVTEGSYVS